MPGKPRMSVQAPVDLMVCWIGLNPLQSSPPIAPGLLDPAAADPLNTTAAAMPSRRPASATLARRRGVARLISPSSGRSYWCECQAATGSPGAPPGRHPRFERADPTTGAAAAALIDLAYHRVG